MSIHAAAVLAAFLVVIAGPAVGGAPLESHTPGTYSIIADGSVHTPVETVQLGGASVNVSSTSAHSGYEPLTVAVTAPTNETVGVELFDANGSQRAVATPGSDGNVSMSTDALSSGTYFLTVRAGGEIRAAERVVVSRHDVTFLLVESTSTAEELGFRISIIPGGDIPYRNVEVVATNGTHEVVTPAPEVRLGHHEATMDRTALQSDEYAVFARLVGEPDPYVGMSEAVTLTINGTTNASADTVGQSAPTEHVTDQSPPVAEELSATTTQLPGTGVVLLLAVLFVGGIALRLRH